MIIPANQLPQETLRAIIENFITREGTDYGEIEYSLGDKVDQVFLLIKRNKIVILFDEDTESISLMDVDDARTHGFFSS